MQEILYDSIELTFLETLINEENRQSDQNTIQLDAINSEGVVAGCHRVSWSEIERVAKLEGWM